MVKEFWLNLPVKDVKKSKQFFSELGFAFDPRHENSDAAAALVLGEKGVIVMLFPEATFQSFSRNEIANTGSASEVLLSIDAESANEVDELIRRSEEAGGTVYAKPGWSQGWMYGAGFTDLDGHRWNVLYMDMSKLPQQ
ncbi:VOC family protein [Paenibacillus sp. NEAU-GSW1]|uniref:VOC family protein n=1 Tax=Paenibacillus sp. NEAU-GSW1 TaxID=2682486 RepID=UPI0012E2328F|nr:VOC family protein [Paenibacillus sp. NEAU-GSW1]MUT66969.1 extradiol dioxygenase [Paenibacillus sp. NEAU-GSW1]